MASSHHCPPVFVSIAFGFVLAAPATATDVILERNGAHNELRWSGGGVFHVTEHDVEALSVAEHPQWNLLIARWRERDAAGNASDLYSVSDDGGVTNQVRRANFTIGLGGVRRDPLIETPDFPEDLLASADTTIYVVQFVTHSLPLYRQALRDLGATLHGYVPHHGYIVEMDAPTRDAVAALPFVRWIGPFHPYYKLAPELQRDYEQFGLFHQEAYTVSTRRRGKDVVEQIAERIRAIGGEVITVGPLSGSVAAILGSEQCLTLLAWDDVGAISRRGQMSPLLDNARAVSGGIYLFDSAGFDGTGVHAEIVDLGAPTETRPQHDHPNFLTEPISHAEPPIHENADHSTAVYGVLFATRQKTDPTDPRFERRGFIVQGTGHYTLASMILTEGGTGTIERLCHTCQLVSDSPNCWDATVNECFATASPASLDVVVQNNSWRPSAATPSYELDAVRIDEAAFTFGPSFMCAQGNEGNDPNPQKSSAYAWGKNVVSVGGFLSLNNSFDNDDEWGEFASVGPSADGRVKPDLVHFYDNVDTTKATTPNPLLLEEEEQEEDASWARVSGTSFSTPIVSGHFGLFYQMWHEGVFGVCDASECVRSGGAATVFDSRPSSFLAKAIMINTAKPYDFTIVGAPNSSLTRDKQGWGKPDLKRLYLTRYNFALIIDESTPLTLNNSATYSIEVPEDTHALRATLVYRDPPGVQNCDYGGGLCRVNDLSMKVWKYPSFKTCYIGNSGLLESNWSPIRGPSFNCDLSTSTLTDDVDTVENVFVESPASGTWNVQVQAMEINADGNVHYINGDPSECIPNPPPACHDPADTIDDAVFALVVSIDRDCDLNGTSDADDGHPVGACCAAGPCEVLPEPCCTAKGGTFAGDQTICDDCNANGTADACEFSPLGACCIFPSETCIQLDACSCLAKNGTYLGDATVCAPLACDAQ